MREEPKGNRFAAVKYNGWAAKGQVAALIAKTDPTRFSSHAKGSDLAFLFVR